MLKQNIINKGKMDKTMFKLKFENNSNSKEYKIKAIYNSKI